VMQYIPPCLAINEEELQPGQTQVAISRSLDTR
jgi:hypothetical protein